MRVVIIGNGISGITAARFIRKNSNYRIEVISDESDYFFSRTALMYVYMGHMTLEHTKPYEDSFWGKNRIHLIRGRVTDVDTAHKMISIKIQDKIQYREYDALIIATGSVPDTPGIPGEDLSGVGKLYSIQDLEYMEACSVNLKRAVIAGGGLIGVEMAEMFHSRSIPVTMLVREKSYWNNHLPVEESEMVTAHIRSHGIDLRLETQAAALKGDEAGRINRVATNRGEEIPCGFAGITTGVKPNIAWLPGDTFETDRGILVNAWLETSVPNVYAIGDCAQLRAPDPGRRSVEAMWYTGRMMGETVARTLCGKPSAYNPGIWFNSAKFFNIEYQVYGLVPSAQAKLKDETVYWQHPENNKSIRVVFQRNTGRVIGFNLMGIRYRQDVCSHWIRYGTHIEEVLSHLSLANFDPELSDSYEAELLNVYNEQYGIRLTLKTGRGAGRVFRFFKNVSQ